MQKLPNHKVLNLVCNTHNLPIIGVRCDNLKAMCKECNVQKHDHLVEKLEKLLIDSYKENQAILNSKEELFRREAQEIRQWIEEKKIEMLQQIEKSLKMLDNLELKFEQSVEQLTNSVPILRWNKLFMKNSGITTQYQFQQLAKDLHRHLEYDGCNYKLISGELDENNLEQLQLYFQCLRSLRGQDQLEKQKPHLYERKCTQKLDLHSNWIVGACLSRSQEQLATCSKDNKIIIWKLENEKWEHQQTLEGHTGAVYSVEFNQCYDQLLSNGIDNCIIVWRQDRNKFWKFSARLSGHTDRIWWPTQNQDGYLLASPSSDKTIRIWHNNSNQEWEIKQILEQHTEAVLSVSFNQNSQYLASGGVDKGIIIWQKVKHQKYQFKQNLEGHTQWINRLCFSRNSNILCSGGGDNTVKLWGQQLDGYFILLQNLIDHSDWINTVKFNYNSSILATASCDKSVKLYRCSSNQWSCYQTLKLENNAYAIEFTNDSKELYISSKQQLLVFPRLQ